MGLGKVRPFLGEASKNLLIFIHFPLDISPLDFAEKGSEGIVKKLKRLMEKDLKEKEPER